MMMITTTHVRLHHSRLPQYLCRECTFGTTYATSILRWVNASAAGGRLGMDDSEVMYDSAQRPIERKLMSYYYYVGDIPQATEDCARRVAKLSRKP